MQSASENRSATLRNNSDMVISIYDELSTTLRRNRDKVNELIEGDGLEYPYLTKVLKSHGGALANRLLQLIEFALAYDIRLPDNPPNIHLTDDGVPIARVKLPGKKLSAKYGGQGTTWYGKCGVIERLCTLGLLDQHKPGNHSPENNTAAENYSVGVAEKHGNHSHPATWYEFHKYTPERLAKAEAKLAENGGKIPRGKDAIRDAYDDKTANRATDTRYGIHPGTVAYREAMRAAAITRLNRDGYFRKDDILADVLSASDAIKAEERAKEAAEDIFSEATKKIFDAAKKERGRIRNAWDEYLTDKGLFKDESLTKPHPPSKEERQRYNLSDGKYIITRRQ